MFTELQALNSSSIFAYLLQGRIHLGINISRWERYHKHLSSIYFIQRTSATKLQLFGDSDTYIANMANNQYPHYSYSSRTHWVLYSTIHRLIMMLFFSSRFPRLNICQCQHQARTLIRKSCQGLIHSRLKQIPAACIVRCISCNNSSNK